MGSVLGAAHLVFFQKLIGVVSERRATIGRVLAGFRVAAGTPLRRA
jgi:hypothetical protein